MKQTTEFFFCPGGLFCSPHLLTGGTKGKRRGSGCDLPSTSPWCSLQGRHERMPSHNFPEPMATAGGSGKPRPTREGMYTVQVLCNGVKLWENRFKTLRKGIQTRIVLMANVNCGTIPVDTMIQAFLFFFYIPVTIVLSN